jgi:hypothetical protein
LLSIENKDSLTLVARVGTAEYATPFGTITVIRIPLKLISTSAGHSGRKQQKPATKVSFTFRASKNHAFSHLLLSNFTMAGKG